MTFSRTFAAVEDSGTEGKIGSNSGDMCSSGLGRGPREGIKKMLNSAAQNMPTMTVPAHASQAILEPL